MQAVGGKGLAVENVLRGVLRFCGMVVFVSMAGNDGSRGISAGLQAAG